jgi:hypothetical protein
VDEIGGSCSTNGRSAKCMHDLVGKAEGKRPMRRSKRRWENNIRMDLREIG